VLGIASPRRARSARIIIVNQFAPVVRSTILDSQGWRLN
jgi:hypothetical protein